MASYQYCSRCKRVHEANSGKNIKCPKSPRPRMIIQNGIRYHSEGKILIWAILLVGMFGSLLFNLDDLDD